MSLHYTFRGAMIIIKARGVTTPWEVTDTLDKIAANPMFTPPAKILLDSRFTDYAPPSADVEALALRIGKIPSFRSSHWAILAHPDSVIHGVGRVFCGYAESNGLAAASFADFLEACQWLMRPDGALSSP